MRATGAFQPEISLWATGVVTVFLQMRSTHRSASETLGTVESKSPPVVGNNEITGSKNRTNSMKNNQQYEK